MSARATARKPRGNEPRNLQDVAKMFPWLRKQIDALYRKARQSETSLSSIGSLIKPNEGAVMKTTKPKREGIRCPNCYGRAYRLYGTHPSEDPNYVWQDAECFPCMADFQVKVPTPRKQPTANSKPATKQIAPEALKRPELPKPTYAEALRRFRREEVKLHEIAGSYGRALANASPNDIPDVEKQFTAKIDKQARIVGITKTVVDDLQPKQPIANKVKKVVENVGKRAKSKVENALLGPKVIGGTPRKRARLSAPVDMEKVKEKLENVRPRASISDFRVEKLVPMKVEVEGGHKLEWGNHQTLSVNEVRHLAPGSQAEDDNYSKQLSDFRRESLAQPKEAKEWLIASHRILSTLPMRLKIVSEDGTVFQAKRDLETPHPYILSYLQLCQMIPAWEQAEKVEDIVSAAALNAAMLPLIKSWRRSRKVGGKPTPANKL